MVEARKERTGWRCEKISERHREWGYGCSAVDLDFVVAEYNYALPVALIEYKEKHALEPDLNDAAYKTLLALADGYHKPLPFFIAIYCTDNWWFRIIPVNDIAKRYYKDKLILTEQRFVKSLYYLRRKVLTDADLEAISKLNDICPDAYYENQTT